MLENVKFIPREIGDLKYVPAKLTPGVYVTPEDRPIELLKAVKAFKVYQLVYDDPELKRVMWKEAGVSLVSPELVAPVEKEAYVSMQEFRILSGIEKNAAPIRVKIPWWKRLWARLFGKSKDIRVKL